MAKHLIAITPELPVANEGNKIQALLDAGWYRVHLRHPGATRTGMRSIIEQIDQRFHSRIVLHGYFDLTNDFNLGGLHLNHRCPQPPALYSGPLSRSCHSINEAANATGMHYVTLSPIFDSISKAGYKSAFTDADLSRLTDISTPVIALGGISPEYFDSLSHYKFAGYAMLGCIPWDDTAGDMTQFARQCIIQTKD